MSLKNTLLKKKSQKKSKGGSIASDLVNQLSQKNNCQVDTSPGSPALSRENIISNYGSSYKTTGGGRTQKKKLLNGGSVASDLVNELVSPSVCDQLPKNVLKVLNKDFIISNYGSSYKTTGGGQIKKKKKAFNENLISKTVSNIKNVLQKKISLNSVIDNIKSYWNKNVNFKLSTGNAKTIIKNLFNSNYKVISKNKNKSQIVKTGGARTVLPRRWFDPNYQDTYMTQQSNCNNCPTGKSLPASYDTTNYYPYYQKSCMVGGKSLPWDVGNDGSYRVDGDSTKLGSYNPMSFSQKFKNEMNGVTTTFKPGRGSVTVSEANSFCNSTNCSPEPSNNTLHNPSITVKNINSDSQYNTEFTSGLVFPRSIANPIGNFGSQGLPIRNQRP